MAPEDIESVIGPPSSYFSTPRPFHGEYPQPGGGSAIRPEEMEVMAKAARKHGLAVHLDGERIFNAAVALSVDVRELTQHVDSVMFCLSKGLGAEVGSMVAGTREFIKHGRRVRNMPGGDRGHSGVLPAAGIVALEKMVGRLAEDHRNPALLVEGLKDVTRIVVDTPPIPTNMVFIETAELGTLGSESAAKLQEQDVLCVAYGTHSNQDGYPPSSGCYSARPRSRPRPW